MAIKMIPNPLVIPLATASYDDLQYLHGDPRVPVFTTGVNKPCDTSKIVHMLVNKEFDSTKDVCTVNLRNARKNMSFIIARNSLGHEREVMAKVIGRRPKRKQFSLAKMAMAYLFAETFEVKRHICYYRTSKELPRLGI